MFRYYLMPGWRSLRRDSVLKSLTALITSAGVAGGVLLADRLGPVVRLRLELARLPPVYVVAGAAIFWLLDAIAVYGPAWRAASSARLIQAVS